MNDVILVFCDSHGEETNGNVRVGQHVVLNVFHREIMSSIRSDVCALCMCHVCKYKHAPLNSFAGKAKYYGTHVVQLTLYDQETICC